MQNGRRRIARRNQIIYSMLSFSLIGTALTGLHPRGASSASAADFADPAFRSVWERTDKLVADGTVKRTFFWGPAPGERLAVRADALKPPAKGRVPLAPRDVQRQADHTLSSLLPIPEAQAWALNTPRLVPLTSC